MTNFVQPELLASTAWLSENLGRPGLRILDARWRPDGSGRDVHARGHIPGARHLDWAATLMTTDEESGQLRLAGPEQVANALGEAGVGDGSTVVVYDDTSSLYAARVWWSLRVYGFESCRVLDGGMASWLAEGRAEDQQSPPPHRATFTPRGTLRMRVATADARELLGSEAVQFVDARPSAEYRGFEGTSRRLGHIPGAVNVPAASLTVPGSQRFRGPDELRSVIRGAAVARGRRLICYDGAGVAATKLALVLTLLGHEDVAVFEGGWADWGDRLDLPVER